MVFRVELHNVRLDQRNVLRLMSLNINLLDGFGENSGVIGKYVY